MGGGAQSLTLPMQRALSDVLRAAPVAPRIQPPRARAFPYTCYRGWWDSFDDQRKRAEMRRRSDERRLKTTLLEENSTNAFFISVGLDGAGRSVFMTPVRVTQKKSAAPTRCEEESEKL